MRLPPYPDYKGVTDALLDKIPTAWQVRKIKTVVDTKITDGPHETPPILDEGVPFLSAEAVKRNKLNFDKKRGYISEDLHRQYCKKVRPQKNDIFMVKSGATTGNIALVDTDEEFSIWSPLALIRTHERAYHLYTFYYLQSDYFRRQVELGWSMGTQENIGMGVLENLFMSYPPMEEQRTIAAFLDHETVKIDTLIAKQDRLIELLKEKRQAVISHAVTKGSDPDVPMKDSGVEWLGEVPVHWEVTRVGWASTYLSYGFTNPMPTTEDGPFMLTANDIGEMSIRYDTARRTDEIAFNEALTDKSKPKKGDVLITKDGTLGRIALADGKQVCINQSVALLRLNKSYLPHFVANALTASVYQGKMIYDAGGTTIKHIYISRLSKMAITLPPIEEQESIVNQISTRTKRYDDIIEKAQQAAKLLTERRTALISAAVTGKIDVRDWTPENE